MKAADYMNDKFKRAFQPDDESGALAAMLATVNTLASEISENYYSDENTPTRFNIEKSEQIKKAISNYEDKIALINISDLTFAKMMANIVLGHFIEAVKVVRQDTGAGLKNSKEYCDQFQEAAQQI
jgi:ribosomal protein L7/L12